LKAARQEISSPGRFLCWWLWPKKIIFVTSHLLSKKTNMDIRINISKALDFITREEIKLFETEFELHTRNIYEKTGKGNDFLGWIELPSKTEQALLDRITADAHRLREQSEVVVVVGIGGSYLGARAVIDALNPAFVQMDGQQKNPAVVYAGHHLDEDYLHELLQLLDQKHYSIIVISKSGTTTEPAVAFRLLRNHLETKYGREAAVQRIIAITDATKGALKKLADDEGYATYVIPDDVGGRYSVLTPVGLLPIAVAGYDISSMVNGARHMEDTLKKEKSLMANPAALYAVVRNMLYQKGKTIEVMAGYNPRLFYLIEWWKQLYGESEGKEQKGIFPAGVGFTTDLHSMGQYIQDGLRNIFETVITIENNHHEVLIPEETGDLDGLNYLAGKRVSFVNRMASQGTMLAHVDGGVPNLEIILPAINENVLGQLIYFFEMGCAISGYILGVNPFDQPGVEAYKKNMFALLEKPGFEEEGAALKKRLG
jgi:glucose-6-phosphate isomerase